MVYNKQSFVFCVCFLFRPCQLRPPHARRDTEVHMVLLWYHHIVCFFCIFLFRLSVGSFVSLLLLLLHNGDVRVVIFSFLLTCVTACLALPCLACLPCLPRVPACLLAYLPGKKLRVGHGGGTSHGVDGEVPRCQPRRSGPLV